VKTEHLCFGINHLQMTGAVVNIIDFYNAIVIFTNIFNYLPVS